MGGTYPVAYRTPARSYHNPGIQRDYGRYHPGTPNTAEKMGRSPWYKPPDPAYPISDIGRGDVYIDHESSRYQPETDYNRGRQAVINHQNRVWRAHYRVTPAITKRAAARAILRGAARAIPYVGPIISAIELIAWLFYLAKQITCGTAGIPGDTRTCFGLKQLALGTTITDYVSIGQVNVNFYRFYRMNGAYEQWRSIGRGTLFNPWLGDGTDKWTAPWPKPREEGEFNRLPWERLDPFKRAPWDPPTNWAPAWDQVPDWRSDPYRSPQEQSQRGYHEPVNDGWPLGWPRPDYSGRPFIRIQWPNRPPIVVPVDPPVPVPQPPVPKPRPEPEVVPGRPPRPPVPDRKPDVRWEEARHERKPPGKDEKESKYKGKVPAPIQKVIGAVTEAMDASEAIFDSLPCKLRRALMKKGGRAGKNFLTPDEKLQAAYRHWEKIDINDLAFNIAKMQAEDMIIGALSGFEARTRQKAFERFGVQQGKSDSSKAGWATKGLKDIEKRLGLTTPGSPCELPTPPDPKAVKKSNYFYYWGERRYTWLDL